MPIQFFLTQDHALLAEYFELRSRVYRRHYPHLAAHFGREEAMDHRSHVVVGFDRRVMAGGRITISWPDRPQAMPMEGPGFRLVDLFPGWKLVSQPYAEFSRVAVDPVCAAGRRCSLGLIGNLARTTAAMGVDLVFSICPEPQVRWNEANSRRCGVEFHVFPEIAVPNPFGIPMTLCAYTGLVAAYSLKLSA
ncbi:MAG TPA: hypothetical protein VMH28_30220 [Candidatus Acidoferrales bacterium]|nr:hypothetical protein [Candidatus Acidoferrales bacterium]